MCIQLLKKTQKALVTSVHKPFLEISSIKYINNFFAMGCQINDTPKINKNSQIITGLLMKTKQGSYVILSEKINC